MMKWVIMMRRIIISIMMVMIRFRPRSQGSAWCRTLMAQNGCWYIKTSSGEGGKLQMHKKNGKFRKGKNLQHQTNR